jgi:rhodanese-related sulfurtransferase
MMFAQRYLKFVVGLILVMYACSPSEKKENDAADNQTVVLDPLEFKSILEKTPEAVLIDVRTPEETADGVIEGAVNIDFQSANFTEQISALDKEKPTFVYCLSGKRSGDAVKQMESTGFKHIYTLKDGLRNWKDQGLGTTKPTE